MKTLEGVKLEDSISYNSTSKQCNFLKNIEIYFYYYPIIESRSGNFTYQLSDIYYLPNTAETIVNPNGDFLTVNLNFVDLTGEDTLETTKQSSAFFPVTLGSIFAPLFE